MTDAGRVWVAPSARRDSNRSGQLLKALCQTLLQCRPPFSVIEVEQMSMMPQIKWDVLRRLSNRNDLFPKGVRNSRFVEDVRVSSGEITNDNERSKDQ